MQVQLEQATGIFSNLWWSTVANDYSIMIFLVISLLLTILNILAKLDPSNKSNEIICLIQGWLYGFPGMKREVKTSETSSQSSTTTTTQTTDTPEIKADEVKPI